MKAIIVPGITDLNKGDQALVWETHRLLEATDLYEEIYILSNGDSKDETDALTQQTKNKGLAIIPRLIGHPRRGKHDERSTVRDTKFTTVKMILFGLMDFSRFSLFLLLCKNDLVSRILLSKEEYEGFLKFKECDTVVVKGGGFLHAYGELFSTYTIWYFLFYVKLGIGLGSKVVIMPNSFGPFSGFGVKYQLRKTLKKVDLIYAREKISMNALENLLRKPVLHEFDLGFHLPLICETDIVNLIEEKYKLSVKSKNIVGLTMRPWRFPTSHNPESAYENYIESYVELSRYLSKNGFNVVFCNQSIGPNTHEDDRLAIGKLKERLEHDKSIYWIDENLTCLQLKFLYSHFDAFVGTRFHSIIFSLTSLVPSLAIGYGGNKSQGIMDMYDLLEYQIPIEDVDSAILISSFEKLISNKKVIKEKLNVQHESIVLSRQRIISSIRKLYEH